MVAPLFAQTSNSNASGSLQTKVLLTVSPFRASFLQPPVVHPANDRFFTPLFSAPSALLFSQLLCCHNHLRCPLVFSDPAPVESPASASSAKSFTYRFYAKSPANPFIYRFYAKMPGRGI